MLADKIGGEKSVNRIFFILHMNVVVTELIVIKKLIIREFIIRI